MQHIEDIAEEVEEIYSNFDHELNKETEILLKDNPNKFYSQHSAWNFMGHIWFDGTLWKEEVWVFGHLQEIKENKDLETLIQSVNLEYGHA